MRLAYSLVGVLSAIVRFAGAFHLLKYCLVGTFAVNSVFMFLASLMSRGCIVWAKKINYIKFENDQIPYVWAALGVLFLMIMSVIAVFNTLRMKKAESK